MSRYSLRSRVTTFYVGMLAIALIVFSAAVYLGVQRFLMRSMERSLTAGANGIVTDFLEPLHSKGQRWFLSEISESYPKDASDTFVRVSSANGVLYQTGNLRDPFVDTSKLPLPSDAKDMNTIRKQKTPDGEQLLIFTVSYKSPTGIDYLVEYGACTQPIQHILRSLFMILLVTTPLILVVAALGGYALMSQPLRPVVTLTERAEKVGRIDLGERLPIIATGDELERLSLALNRMIERLEETVSHNRRFSADASHELRTPLTIIRGELEALQQTPGLESSVLEGAGSALEECHRMSTIVESLMAISRLEGGGERMEMAPVDLVSVTKTTLDHLLLLAEEKRISLGFEGNGSVTVMGNAMRLKQVIVNLVDNAIKYTPEEGAVRVSVLASGDTAVLSVTDSGIGIPSKALPLIFERFYRADEVRSRSSGGIGLGLAIVKSICTAHQGVITAKSVEGQGSTFRMELPLISAPASATRDSQTASQPSRRQASPIEGLASRETSERLTKSAT